MKLKEFLEFYNKKLSPIYLDVFSNISAEDLQYSYRQIIINERVLPANPIPTILSYLPSGNKSMFQKILIIKNQCGTDTKNDCYIAYTKMNTETKDIVNKLGGWLKIYQMDVDKLFYGIKDLTNIVINKLLEEKNEKI